MGCCICPSREEIRRDFIEKHAKKLSLHKAGAIENENFLPNPFSILKIFVLKDELLILGREENENYSSSYGGLLRFKLDSDPQLFAHINVAEEVLSKQDYDNYVSSYSSKASQVINASGLLGAIKLSCGYYLLAIEEVQPVARIYWKRIYRVDSVIAIPLFKFPEKSSSEASYEALEESLKWITKGICALICDGGFVSYSYDITRTIQQQVAETSRDKDFSTSNIENLSEVNFSKFDNGEEFDTLHIPEGPVEGDTQAINKEHIYFCDQEDVQENFLDLKAKIISSERKIQKETSEDRMKKESSFPLSEEYFGIENTIASLKGEELKKLFSKKKKASGREDQRDCISIVKLNEKKDTIESMEELQRSISKLISHENIDFQSVIINDTHQLEMHQQLQKKRYSSEAMQMAGMSPPGFTSGDTAKSRKGGLSSRHKNTSAHRKEESVTNVSDNEENSTSPIRSVSFHVPAAATTVPISPATPLSPISPTNPPPLFESQGTTSSSKKTSVNASNNGQYYPSPFLLSSPSFIPSLNGEKNKAQGEEILQHSNEMFLFNMNLLLPFVSAPISTLRWFLRLIYGAVTQKRFQLGERKWSITLIARRSRHHFGPRYYKRGVNEKGYVANEVECEQVLWEDGQLYDCINQMRGEDGTTKDPSGEAWIKGENITRNWASYVISRGSIPLLWGHSNMRTIAPAIEFYPSEDEKYLMELHFMNLYNRFGSPVHILNLVRCEQKHAENALEYAFNEAVRALRLKMEKDDGELTEKICLFILEMYGFEKDKENKIYWKKSIINKIIHKTSTAKGSSIGDITDILSHENYPLTELLTSPSSNFDIRSTSLHKEIPSRSASPYDGFHSKDIRFREEELDTGSLRETEVRRHSDIESAQQRERQESSRLGEHHGDFSEREAKKDENWKEDRVYVCDMKDLQSTDLYQYIAKETKREIFYKKFDWLHTEATLGFDSALRELLRTCRELFDETGCFIANHSVQKKKKIITLQEGVARINCVDCLDRTNLACFALGVGAVTKQLAAFGCVNTEGTFDLENQKGRKGEGSPNSVSTSPSPPVGYNRQRRLSVTVDTIEMNNAKQHIFLPPVLINLILEMWSHVGDEISNQYAGTVAMHTPQIKMHQNDSTTSNGLWKVKKKGGGINIGVKRYWTSLFSDQERLVLCDILMGKRTCGQIIELYKSKKSNVKKKNILESCQSCFDDSIYEQHVSMSKKSNFSLSSRSKYTETISSIQKEYLKRAKRSFTTIQPRGLFLPPYLLSNTALGVPGGGTGVATSGAGVVTGNDFSVSGISHSSLISRHPVYHLDARVDLNAMDEFVWNVHCVSVSQMKRRIGESGAEAPARKLLDYSYSTVTNNVEEVHEHLHNGDGEGRAMIRRVVNNREERNERIREEEEEDKLQEAGVEDLQDDVGDENERREEKNEIGYFFLEKLVNDHPFILLPTSLNLPFSTESTLGMKSSQRQSSSQHSNELSVKTSQQLIAIRRPTGRELMSLGMEISRR